MLQKENYLSEDTIAALSTPTGGAVAIVRMSGPASFKIHLRLIQAGVHSSELTLRRLTLGTLYSETCELLDQALWVAFARPDTYTGENLIEYHIHGNPWIAQRLLETLSTYGARQALPGEFSFRAVRNGKMSLFQAQAVADLIAATNDSAVSVALEKVTGSQAQHLTSLGQDLREIAALSEIGIDFADQDVEEVSLPRLKERLRPTIQRLEELSHTYSRGVQLQDGVRVALVGLPNAGKSSFFNALLGEDRSIVSEVAGTTRDVIRERLTLRGQKTTVTLRLEDTAGLRSTQDAVEKFGIERTLDSARNADLILWIIDPNSFFGSLEQLPAQLASQQVVAVLTKVDTTDSKTLDSAHKTLHQLGISTTVKISSTTGQGVSKAAQKIAEICEKSLERKPGELILTRLDHANAVHETLTHLRRSVQVPEIDLFASDLRQALNSLAPLIGETLPDDILGKIFSNFCIGK
jgi:tRNA modification GTPase